MENVMERQVKEVVAYISRLEKDVEDYKENRERSSLGPSEAIMTQVVAEELKEILTIK